MNPYEELEDQWSKWTIAHDGTPPRIIYCDQERLEALKALAPVVQQANGNWYYAQVTRIMVLEYPEKVKYYGPFLARGGMRLSSGAELEPRKKKRRFWQR